MSVKKTSQILKLKLKKSKLAIIDIGSNSVRLVIYPDLENILILFLMKELIVG